jgi:hypothetical protein
MHLLSGLVANLTQAYSLYIVSKQKSSFAHLRHIPKIVYFAVDAFQYGTTLNHG